MLPKTILDFYHTNTKDYDWERIMFKKADWGKALLVFFLISLFIFTGCQRIGVMVGSGTYPEVYSANKDAGPPPWAPAHGRRAKYNYRYYPTSRVYYEEGSKVYFYYRDGQWHMSASIPVGIRINANDFVTLEMDTDRPYEYDDDVVKRYPPGQVKKENKKKGKNK